MIDGNTITIVIAIVTVGLAILAYMSKERNDSSDDGEWKGKVDQQLERIVELLDANKKIDEQITNIMIQCNTLDRDLKTAFNKIDEIKKSA